MATWIGRTYSSGMHHLTPYRPHHRPGAIDLGLCFIRLEAVRRSHGREQCPLEAHELAIDLPKKWMSCGKGKKSGV